MTITSRISLVLLTLCVSAAGCVSGDSSTPSDSEPSADIADEGATPDTPPSQPGDNPGGPTPPAGGLEATCSEVSGTPSLAGAKAFVGAQEEMPQNKLIDVAIPLNTDASPDLLLITLWQGYGVFESGITAGTHSLSGAEANPDECGACVSIVSDVAATPQAGSIAQSKFLAASVGTLTLSAVSTTAGERLTGTLSGVSFREIEDAEVAGGCTATLGELAFDVVVNAAPQSP